MVIISFKAQTSLIRVIKNVVKSISISTSASTSVSIGMKSHKIFWWINGRMDGWVNGWSKFYYLVCRGTVALSTQSVLAHDICPSLIQGCFHTSAGNIISSHHATCDGTLGYATYRHTNLVLFVPASTTILDTWTLKGSLKKNLNLEHQCSNWANVPLR